MPNYDPENLSENNQYDPYNNSQPQGPVLMQTLGSMAKSLVVVGALNIAGVAITKKISQGAATGLKRYYHGPLGNLARSSNASNLGEVFKATDTGKSFFSAIKKTGIYKSHVQRTTHLQNFAKVHPERLGLERITSAFKNPSTLAATYAKSWIKNVGYGIGVAYGADVLTGVTSKDMGLEKKALWDVPGKIMNFAKWTGQMSIFGPMFGSLGPVAGAVGSAARQGLAKAFRGPLGQAMVKGMSKLQGAKSGIDPAYKEFYNETILNGLRSKVEQKSETGIIGKALAVGKTIPEIYRNARLAFDASVQDFPRNGTITERIKKASNPVINAIKNAKEIYRENKSNKAAQGGLNHYGVNLYKQVHEIARNQKIAGGDLTGVINAIGPAMQHLNKKNLVEEIFGLEPVRVKDVVSRDHISETLGLLKSKFPTGNVAQLMSHVENMRVGTHIYRGHGGKIQGGGVDLSAFDPILSAKRAASKLTQHQFRVPLTKLQMSIADITHWDQYLSDGPGIYATNKKPAYLYKGAHGKGSVGEMAESDDALFMYMRGPKGGVWSIFDGKGPKAITTDRVLRYSTLHGAFKQNEQKEINIHRWKASLTGAEYNDRISKLDPGPNVTNPFMNFLVRKANLDLPGFAQSIKGKFVDALEGKKGYAKASADLILNGNFQEFHQNLPFIENLYSHTSQDFSRILSSKGALSTIAKYVDSNLLKNDLVDTMFNTSGLQKRAAQLDLSATSWQRKKGIHSAIATMEAFPTEARTHIVTKKIGTFSEMTSYDVVKTAVADEILTKNYLGKLAQGKDHPLINAIPELLEKGHITEKEAKSLKLHAKLSTLDSQGFFSAKGHSGVDPVFDTLRSNMKKNIGWDNHAMHAEIIDFVQHAEMRSPKVKNLHDKILNDSVPDFISDNLPFTSMSTSPFGIAKDYGTSIMNTFTGVLSEALPFKKHEFKHHGLAGGAKYIGGIIASTAAFGAAYRIADFGMAVNPVFDDTMFEDGITPAAADAIAKGRMGLSRVSDAVGLTRAVKYVDGLMPGAASTLPGAIAGAVASTTFGGGPLRALGWMAKGAIMNRFASPYLPNFGKTYEELRKEYSGEEMVPFRKSPTWLLGGTPWEGTKVEGYEPNWYVKAKSRWKASDSLYGSEFRKLIHEPLPLLGFNIGDITSPYFLERKHYFDRPYGKTGELFSEVPIIGPVLASTIGKIIKPQKTMHQEFLQGEWADGSGGGTSFAQRPPNLQEGLGMMGHSLGIRRTAGMSAFNGTFGYSDNKNWSQVTAQQTLDNVTAAAGLQGFLAKSAMELVAPPTVIPTLETAGRMASMSRSYYDMNLGGMGFLTEGVRRLMQRPDYKRYGLNPIPNMMPDWLPEQFLTGDPFVKIMKGELRLPGAAYNKTHSQIINDMPGRASMLGADIGHSVQYFTGMLPPTLKEEYDILDKGTRFHAQIQDTLASEGLLIQAEALVADVKNRITGHVDAIIRDGKGGKGRRALEIKTISDEGFKKLDAPKHQHVGQLNFYLKMLGIQKGSFLYVNRDNPSQTKTFDISYNQFRWQKDLDNLTKARQISADMMQEGRQDNFGNSYSWLDRLEILSDTAPWSKEYKEVQYLVEKQIQDGQFTQKEISRFETSKKHKSARMRRYDLYPTRFKNKIMSPDTELNLQSINENIKSAASYSMPERCFDKNTNIETIDNVKKISEIIIGDIVRTHDNKFEKVTRISNRKVENFEKVYDLQVQSRESTKVTEEHPYYVIKVDKCYNWSNLKSVCVKKNNKKCKTCKYKKYENYKHEWIPVKDLTNDHFIATPILPIKDDSDKLDLWNILNKYKDIETNDNIIRFSKYNSKENNQRVQIPRYIDKTPELYEIFGWYIAEGSRNKADYSYNGINFSFNKSEENIAIRLCYLFNKIFNVKTFQIKQTSENGIVMRLFSSLIAILFEELFNHGAKNKTIKPIVYNTNNENLYSLVNSFWLGDGYYKKNIKVIKVISSSLIYITNNILLHLGYLPSINFIKGGKEVIIHNNKNKSIISDCWKVSWIENHEMIKNRFINNGMYYTRLLNKKEIIIDMVYNLEVENSHSYIANGLSVHNCVGSLWEGFTNTNFFLINKLWAFKDPLEHYKMSRLYGKEYKPWSEPIKSFIEPSVTNMLSQDNPISAAGSFAAVGSVLGGNLGGAIGASLGSIYGSIHGLYRKATGSTYIPGLIQDQREIDTYFDRLKYARSDRMSQLTSGLVSKAFRDEGDATMFAFNKDGKDIGGLFKGSSYAEKPYLSSFINVQNNKDRQEILRFLPEDMQTGLKKAWGLKDGTIKTEEFNKENSAYLADGAPRFNFNQSYMDPSIALDDIKLKTIEDRGLNTHDFGLGWNEQALRIQNNINGIHAVNSLELDQTTAGNAGVSSAAIRSALTNFFSKEGIYANIRTYINHNIDVNNVSITIKRDSAQRTLNSLRNRERYM